MKNGTGINDETAIFAVGPIELNVVHARVVGWSQKAIERVASVIRKTARRENGIAHRNGPVVGCPCVVCDRKVPLAGMPDEYAVQRQRWIDRGVWPA